MENIDYEKLRKDLMDYFGTAYMSGFGVAIMELSRVQRASNEELVRIAIECNFNLNDYIVLSR